MAKLPPELRSLVVGDNNNSEWIEQQISEDIVYLLERIQQGKEPTQRELDTILVSPVEAGAVLSVRSQRHISHRYVKERARTHGKDKMPLNPKLTPARVIGKTHLYPLRQVWDLGAIRQYHKK